MCRTLTLALVPALLLVTWHEAHADRFLTFSGQSTGGTYYIGAQSLGSPTITTLLGPATLAPAESSNLLRERFMPEIGIANVGKRAESRINGLDGIQVFHGDNVQFWVSLDQASWQLLIVGESPIINGVSFKDMGSNAPTAATTAGGVPAIGGVGLTVLVVAMLATGGYILKRRQADPAA